MVPSGLTCGLVLAPASSVRTWQMPPAVGVSETPFTSSFGNVKIVASEPAHNAHAVEVLAWGQPFARPSRWVLSSSRRGHRSRPCPSAKRETLPIARSAFVPLPGVERCTRQPFGIITSSPVAVSRPPRLLASHLLPLPAPGFWDRCGSTRRKTQRNQDLPRRLAESPFAPCQRLLTITLTAQRSGPVTSLRAYRFVKPLGTDLVILP